MAITNYERVGKALELLRDGLAPYVERELGAALGKYWITEATAGWRNELVWPEGQAEPQLDVAALLHLMWDQWNQVFRKTLGFAERSLVSELREERNKWAHQNSFSSDDADRALDTAARLLAAISAPQADEINKMKVELRRLVFEEQSRSDRRRNTGTAIESAAAGALKPWREVISPHEDVANGSYQTAEFAADLWQVYRGEGVDEYADPVQFFRRTYLTASLTALLGLAMRRIRGQGGDPVVQLQTNFGGGKTHSMLALYHLFSGVRPTELPGIEPLLEGNGSAPLPKVNRVVLVGNKISPGRPDMKADGTVVRTLWGEMAWQLGNAAGGVVEAKRAFSRIEADDVNATSPGDELRALMDDYGPCLILIDEWVAYARQLHDDAALPAGSFETHFTFAQALTESAKAAKQCLLVVSLPSSDTTGSPHSQAEDVEVGGERGRAALDRLRNAVGRVETSWRPASVEEGFEIVRRRLFEPLTERTQFVERDGVARAFHDLYATQASEFPPDSRSSDYEARLKSAYPIHPELFDRLYTDWSTLVKFQRTRGVLRLMAAVIHSLWDSPDRSPLIMPANIPIDDPRVQAELTRYLSDNWVPIIESDVDGPGSLPRRLDGQVTNLGRFSATQRVARTIYLGSAPSTGAANLGIEDRQIKLGCVMPGERPEIFGDALRRLSTEATYLYQDGPRYWYSTQPTVTKLADDRAEERKRKPETVAKELERRLRLDLRDAGDFARIHAFPQSGQDVPDDYDARLVVLSTDYPYSRDAGSAAENEAIKIFESRGSSPRLFRNALTFLAIDEARWQDLDGAVRRYLAWQSILDDKDQLNLTPHQVRQAQTQLDSANGAVDAQVPEAYRWVISPVQAKPESPIEWKAFTLIGQGSLAARASQRLRKEELLVTSLAGTLLRMELDRVPLWRGDHVTVAQLAEDFARYPYLPRLKTSGVLIGAIRDGLGLMLWRNESFAYADAFDDAAQRYRGLRGGQLVQLADDNLDGLVVRPDVAVKQLEAEAPAPPKAADTDAGDATRPTAPDDPDTLNGPPPEGQAPAAPAAPHRYHATVALNPQRAGADAGRVAEEVIAHLVGQLGADVKVTLEIEANLPAGAPESVVRIVTENGRTLKFTSQGFEAE